MSTTIGIGYVQTPNIGLYKPVYQADLEMWGNHLNRNADTLDAMLSPYAGGAFLPIAGGVMQGALTLAADPTSNLQAATKQYVDAHSGTGGGAGYLPLSGGALTGPLTLAADPAAAMQPVTLQYYNAHVPTATASAYLAKAGGTMTGTLTLAGNATANLSPVTLQQMNAANAGFLPLTGGRMNGAINVTTTGSTGTLPENYPLMDFRGGNISFQRKITNATPMEAGANPKVWVQLENACSNYQVQPWGGYDGPVAFQVQGISDAGSTGSVFSLRTNLISQSNNNYTSQDTSLYVSVDRRGQSSCWGIAVAHSDNTGMPCQAFSTMAIENAMSHNGPDQPASYYDCTSSNRQAFTIIPSVNPTNTWTANQLWSVGTLMSGTPSGGVATVYVAQNTGTTGPAQPVWPTSGNVIDGTITWKTGTTVNTELGVGIMVGGGRPQLPGVVIVTGLAFNCYVGNACIDTTRGIMTGTNAAAIRMAEGHLIDFTGGGNNANKNRRTLGYNDSTSSMLLSMNGGVAAMQWKDDGTVIASHNVLLAGQSNLSGVTTADVNHLTIGKNAAGFGEIDLIVGAADFINFYGTDTSGNINVPSPFISLGQANSTFQGNLTVNGTFQGVGRSILGSNANLSGITTGYSDLALTVGRNQAGNNNINFITGQYGLSLFNTNGSGVISTPYATFGGTGGSSFAGNLTVNGAFTGATVSLGANVNWPGPGPYLYSSNFNVGGTVASGQQPVVESHVFGDAANATSAQGGGLTWARFGGNVNAGAVGGRTAFGATLTQTGATTIGGAGQYYVASAFWAIAAYSAGGAAGTLRGNLFASNDAAFLKTGAGAYWNTLVGYELDISAQASVGVAYKQGMKIVLWADDASAGTAGYDYAYSITAQGPGGVQPGWNVGYCFGSPDGVWAIKPTGTLIGTVPGMGGGPGYAAAYGVDFSQVTFSQNAFRSPGFSVDSSGDVQTRALYVGASVASIDNTGLLTATGGTLSGALHFGSTTVASRTDLTKHLDLYGGQWGFNILSNGHLNVAMASGGAIEFSQSTTFIGDIDATGLNYMPIGATGAAAGNFTQVAVGSASGPTWTTGAGAPSGTQPAGSLYSRTAGATGTRLYVSAGGGTWNAVSGV